MKFEKFLLITEKSVIFLVTSANLRDAGLFFECLDVVTSNHITAEPYVASHRFVKRR
jgi:hypothetical protein